MTVPSKLLIWDIKIHHTSCVKFLGQWVQEEGRLRYGLDQTPQVPVPVYLEFLFGTTTVTSHSSDVLVEGY